MHAFQGRAFMEGSLYTKILPNTNRMEMDDPTVDDLSETINKFHLSDPMQVNEFLIFQMITNLFKKSQRHIKKILMK